MAVTTMWEARVVQAQAYCGAAHGLTWSLNPDNDPPDVVDLPVEGSVESYRLVYHPRTGQRARDHHGNFLYVPARRSRPAQRATGQR